MSWPAYFDSRVVQKIEKSWRDYAGMLPGIRSGVSALSQELLQTGSITPASMRVMAQQILVSGVHLYPTAEWSKIIYRLDKTLGTVVTQIEGELGLNDIDLLEARFEIGEHKGIDRYAEKMVDAGRYADAVSLCQRLIEAGSDGAAALANIIKEHARGGLTPEFIELIDASQFAGFDWGKDSSVSFYYNYGHPKSALEFCQALVDGRLGWSPLSVRFVDGRIRSEVHHRSGRGAFDLVRMLEESERYDLVKGLYGARVSTYLRPVYSNLLEIVLPAALLEKPNRQDIYPQMVAVMSVISGAAPTWLSKAIEESCDELYVNSPSIHHAMYRVAFSKTPLEEIPLTQRFVQGLGNWKSALFDTQEAGFWPDKYFEWDYSTESIQFNRPDIGECVMDIFRDSLSHVDLSRSKSTLESGFDKIYKDSDIDEFLAMSGLIIKRTGHTAELLDMLTNKYKGQYPLICRFAEALLIDRDELLKHPTLRDSVFSEDLGL